MSDYRFQSPSRPIEGAVIDQGLRSYMMRVYNYMAVGLVITGVVAFALFQQLLVNPQLVQALYVSPLRWLVIGAPFLMVIGLSFGINRLSPAAAQGLFWVYSALMGVSLASLGLIYTGASIAQVFFVCAATFAALSLWGYTTKRDLTGWGSFLFMGLIGMIIASLVSLVFHSSALNFAISIIGVLVFTGFTAYDTQKIKSMYYAAGDEIVLGRTAVIGALNLYMDFINLFLSVLNLFGNRR